MKKIVSTQGLLYGHFDEINLNNAIRERINPKLEYYYNFHDFTDGDVHVDSKLSYDLMEGQVTSILLSYTIDNPSHQRLEDFRSICECFFELYGFMIDYDDRIPSVFYRATDLYEMACLIHALEYLSVSLEGIMCPVDCGLTEKDAIYSPSGTYLLQLPDVPRYRIKEGTIFICPSATRYCKRLRYLDIPVDLSNNREVLSSYPYPLKIKEWDKHYDGTPVECDDDLDDDMSEFDDHEVGYSKDGKILMGCRHTFNDTHYEVPIGVEEIDDGAFLPCRHYVELSIPRSVKKIGDYIFGNGGVINIRDE